jgi:hypothetical protein
MSHALVSTPFGIGSLPGSTDAQDGREGFTRVQFAWGTAYLAKNQIAEAPEFTFYAVANGKRTKFSLSFPLTGLASELIKLVRGKLQLDEDVAITLVQTDSVSKHELKPEKTIGDCMIGSGPQHPILVLKAPLVRFDPQRCSFYILLQEKNAAAVQVAKGFGSVIGNADITIGVKYWEIKLESARGGDGVFIGVGSADVPLNGSILSRGIFWGISCGTGHKLHDTIDYYAEPFRDGDVVGVLLDMERGHLTFYKNGVSLGVAFSHIQAKRLCPIFSLTFVGQKIRLLSAASAPLR